MQPARRPAELPATVRRTLLEDGFPFLAVSTLAKLDHPLADGVYSSHKWWARRPRAVIRALILAAHLPVGQTTVDEFWKKFASNSRVLEGKHVGDPFSGGATSLVESARLGASVSGADV